VSADRSHHLRQALDAIHRRWGSESLRPLSTLSAASACIPTGYPELDAILGGGIPCGKITEFSGPPTCGATTLALRTIHQAQSQGRVGVYIDLAQAFDPVYAVGCGVQLDGLLIARPDDLAAALDIMDMVAGEGGAGLVVLDGIPREQPSAGGESLLSRALRKLSPALRQSGCTALMLNPGAASVSLAQQAALRLALENRGWIEAGRDICGCRAQATVLKSRGSRPDQHAELAILFEDRAQEEAA